MMNKLATNSLSPWPMRYDYYLVAAQQWSHVFQWLFEKNKQQSLKVCELCPGWSPKIALGAWLSQKVDSYNAYDNSAVALKQLHNFLKHFPLQIKTDQANILKDKFTQHDLIILNHAIDDLLLYSWCHENDIAIDTIFENHLLLRNYWKKLISESGINKKAFITTLAKQLTMMAHQNTQLIIAQYPGYQEKLWQMSDAIAFTKEITEQVLTELVKMGWKKDSSTSSFLNKLNKPWLSSDQLHLLIRY